MIAYDNDIFSELVLNNSKYVLRALAYPLQDQKLPIVAAGESLRGQLASVRRAESPNSKTSLPIAYEFLQRTMEMASRLELLPFDNRAEQLVSQWRAIKIGINDKRIAAICIVHNIRLVTRNARDFQQVPGLQLEIWN